ncbi:MAG: tRNA (adenosine(37)-N6)-threonylcarbamoyltransferase complex dimerization subunit type 1 TsaB [Bacteroidota bacterium]
MMILGIETSTTVCSVGLSGDENQAIERSMVESRIHYEKLQTLIQAVLKEAGARVGDIDAVAISIGPGSFTGLRVGLSTAKGLCFSIEKRLLAIPSFEAIATAAARSYPLYERFFIALDAKQSDFYTGSFRNYSGLIETETDVAVRPSKSIGQEMRDDGKTLVLTDTPLMVAEVLKGAFRCEHVLDFCRGEVVASIGMRKYKQKEFSDLSSTEPLYLKDFVVKTEALQTHA